MRGQRLLPFMLLCTPLFGQFIHLENRAGIARDSSDRVTGEVVLTGTTFFLAAESFPALARRGVRVPEAQYVLWAWVREDAPVSIFLGEDEYFAEATEKDAEKPRFLWRTVGTASFSRGTITVKAEKGAASVAALCLTHGADIKKLWPAMWARPEEPAPVPDSRAATCRHINQAYETWTFPSPEAWLKRATHLRRHLLAACGLWPPPRKTPLNARIFGRIERDTYSVEKVHFEPWPGFYTTGNLYRPRGKTGPFPAVLCPHGHWGEGRFTDNGEPQGGVPPRSITLAKLGCIAFSYDMVGFGDSKRQMAHTIDSKANELWGTSLMKLQLWSGIRGIDFLMSLPDVDDERIGCTGASGGGTQTFMLMAVDDRVKVAAPVNMVSAFMQGGCECENAPLLRLDTINPEIASLMAPRPLLLVSATGDWTSKTPSVEYPMVRAVYELFGAADRVKNVHLDGPHNYNRSSREAMYDFFLTHLMGVDTAKPYTEPPYTIEKREDLSVWAGGALPEGALDRAGLEAFLAKEARARLAGYAPRNKKQVERFRTDMGSAYAHTVYIKGRTEGGPVTAEFLGLVEPVGAAAMGGVRLLLSRDDQTVPAILYLARPGTLDAVRGQAAALIVHPEGKAALAGVSAGQRGEHVRALLKRNAAVLAIDTFFTGEFHSPFGATQRTRIDRRFTTYNRTTVVERVRDILLAAAFLQERVTKRPAVIGLGRAGRWVALAGPFLSKKTVILADVRDYISDSEAMWLGEDFTPSILAVGALKTATALSAPRRLTLFNVNPGFHSEWPYAAYHVSGEAEKLAIVGHDLNAGEIATIVAEE